MRRVAGAVAVVAVVLLPGCSSGSTSGSAASDDQSKTIGRSTFAAWPLTVDSGLLKCAGSGGTGKVTIEVAGKTYAVNGLASGDKSNLEIRPIWADAETAGLKKEIGSLIEEGLRLCK